MKEILKNEIDEAIKELNMYLDDAFVSNEEGIKTLNIVLDSDEIIDVDRITKASEIINPIIDEKNLIEESYVLDIYSKEKGEDNNE